MATTKVSPAGGTADDRRPYLVATGTNGENGSGLITWQLTDAAGNDLAAYFAATTWYCAAENGAPHAADDDFSVNDGTELEEVAANEEYRVLSDATGKISMVVDDNTNDTLYAIALLGGVVYSGSVTVTGHE